MNFFTMFKLYSVQIVAVLAAINTAIAVRPDTPWWVYLVINLLGLAAHHYARAKPQPAVTAQLQAQKLAR